MGVYHNAGLSLLRLHSGWTSPDVMVSARGYRPIIDDLIGSAGEIGVDHCLY